MRHLTDDEIEIAFDWLRDNAETTAQAVADRKYIDEFRKVKKAQLMKIYAEAGVKSIQAQEREAYADPAYTEHLDAMHEATAREERLKFQKETYLAKIEAWRTASSNLRARI